MNKRYNIESAFSDEPVNIPDIFFRVVMYSSLATSIGLLAALAADLLGLIQ